MRRHAPLPAELVDELVGSLAVGDVVQVRISAGAPRIGRVHSFEVIGRWGAGEHRAVPQVRIDVIVRIETRNGAGRPYFRRVAPVDVTCLSSIVQNGQAVRS